MAITGFSAHLFRAQLRGSSPNAPSIDILPSSTWESLVEGMLNRLRTATGPSAYLRFICNFLLDVSRGSLSTPSTASQASSAIPFEAILFDTDIHLPDRLGLALRFLPHVPLTRYLDTLRGEAVVSGALDGLLLTGLTAMGLDVLQAYMDRTGDIQTVALIVARMPLTKQSLTSYLPPASIAMASSWLDIYRELLDSWQAWEKRAILDVKRMENIRSRWGG